MNHGLRVDNIVKDVDGKRVLDNISFRVNPGQVLALVGHSGSGKTTLLKTINRLIEIDSGEIFLYQQSIKDIDPVILRQRAGMVFQIPTMFDGNVKQNIMFGLKLVDKQISKKTLLRALQDAGLTEKFLNRNASKLSVGEQQRVAIARALVLEPEVLLLDEPTAALDPKLTYKIENTILHLCKARNLMTLWVSHDHAQARRVGDQLGILKHGIIKILNNEKDLKNVKKMLDSRSMGGGR
jgi:ABC-type sugar transport system ATPase subunit